MNRSQKHFESLLKLFDAAAKQWGWESDQGWGQRVEEARLEYEKTKKHLTNYINRKLGE